MQDHSAGPQCRTDRIGRGIDEHEHGGNRRRGETAARILDGVRVVDCSEGIAGPVAALMLAEAGADVIKVEPPDGDRSRASEGFLTWNRSKRSVVLDLGAEGGRGQLDRLLEGADVLIHGFGPVTAAELGLTDEELAARHPQLVTCAVLAWPAGHPSAEGPIDDLLVSARLGLCDEQRGHRDGPVFLRFPFGSWCAVYLSTIGVLARLIQRQRGGAGGGPAHTSIAQGALVPTMMHWARAETPGPMFAWGLPKDLQPSLFECADGVWVHLMRCADTDSPLMVRGAGRPGRGRGGRGQRHLHRALHSRLPELRRQPGGLPHPPQPAVAGRLLGPRHPGPGGCALRRHPGRRAGPAERLRDRGGRPRAGSHRPGRDPLLDPSLRHG